MKIREHRGFQSQVYEYADGCKAEIYRKDSLLHTVADDHGGRFKSSSSAIAIEAAVSGSIIPIQKEG